MANKSFIIIVLVLPSFMQMGYSQDPEFSQFYANPLYLNPALAGRQRYAQGQLETSVTSGLLLAGLM